MNRVCLIGLVAAAAITAGCASSDHSAEIDDLEARIDAAQEELELLQSSTSTPTSQSEPTTAPTTVDPPTTTAAPVPTAPATTAAPPTTSRPTVIELDGDSFGPMAIGGDFGRVREWATATFGPPTDDELDEPVCPALGWGSFFLTMENDRFAGYSVFTPTAGGIAFRTTDGVDTRSTTSELINEFGEAGLQYDDIFGSWFELPSGLTAYLDPDAGDETIFSLTAGGGCE